MDIGQLIAGPFGATMLGDFGAEVIKVEQPGIGDALRGTPVDGKAQRSGNWLVEARNKKSITLNLRVEAGQKILKDLVKQTDVLFENCWFGDTLFADCDISNLHFVDVDFRGMELTRAEQFAGLAEEGDD